MADPELLDRFMGLTGILVLFSLAGGPSFFLVSGLGCFRAYGRAGLLALALWCVAAPVILQAALRCRPSGRLRNLACACLMALALFEGHRAAAWYPWDVRMEIPEWVDWLARQPADVRLAAFPRRASISRTGGATTRSSTGPCIATPASTGRTRCSSRPT